MHFTFKPMNEADARAIQAWRYKGPYSIYNQDDYQKTLTNCSNVSILET